jgi:hypothetical protein
MKKYIPITLKIIFSLIIVTPILGMTGVFPGPTRELYNTDAAFAFIELIMYGAPYVAYINAVVCALTLWLLWTKKEAGAALLVLPLTVHVMAFHAFLDGGLLTAGAIMGNIMCAINIYWLYLYRTHYKSLFFGRMS